MASIEVNERMSETTIVKRAADNVGKYPALAEITAEFARQLPKDQLVERFNAIVRQGETPAQAPADNDVADELAPETIEDPTEAGTTVDERPSTESTEPDGGDEDGLATPSNNEGHGVPDMSGATAGNVPDTTTDDDEREPTEEELVAGRPEDTVVTDDDADGDDSVDPDPEPDPPAPPVTDEGTDTGAPEGEQPEDTTPPLAPSFGPGAGVNHGDPLDMPAHVADPTRSYVG